MQSRISNLLAIGLMSALGLGMLTWYYANAVTRQSHARESVQASAAKRAPSGDAPLPSLGRIDPPVRSEAAPAGSGAAIGRDAGQRRCARFLSRRRRPRPGYGATPPKTSAQLALERQLSGTRIRRRARCRRWRRNRCARRRIAAAGAGRAELRCCAPASPRRCVRRCCRRSACCCRRVPFIDCTLETAIDSTLPGMTTCVTATDTFGVDGKSCCWSAAPSSSAKPEARCSRGRREYSCCGPRPARPPA